jgi:hypothetical protein
VLSNCPPITIKAIRASDVNTETGWNGYTDIIRTFSNVLLPLWRSIGGSDPGSGKQFIEKREKTEQGMSEYEESKFF